MIDPLFKVAQKIYERWTFNAAPKFNNPPELPFYAVADLPDPALHEGTIVYVSDGASGAVFRGSNGTSWVSLG